MKYGTEPCRQLGERAAGLRQDGLCMGKEQQGVLVVKVKGKVVGMRSEGRQRPERKVS